MERVHAIVCFLMLASWSSPSSADAQALNGASQVLAGVVRDRRTKQPILHAEVTVLETNQKTFSGSHGEFQLMPHGAGTYTIRARLIGYIPAQQVVRVPDTNSVLTLELGFPADGPMIDSTRLFEFWQRALEYYHPQEAKHARLAAELTGVGNDASNRGAVPIVLQADSTSPRGSFTARLLDSLVMLGLASRTCYPDSECGDTVFTTYLTLGRPREDAPDTIAVPIKETAINHKACQRPGGSMGGTSSTTLYVIRESSGWRVTEQPYFRLSGSVLCGRP